MKSFCEMVYTNQIKTDTTQSEQSLNHYYAPIVEFFVNICS